MARRAFDVIDVVEILQHWHAGRRPTEVAASLGVDPRTVRKYTARAGDAGIVPGGAPLIREQWVELVRDWFPELVDARVRSLTYPEIDAHRARIEAMLETNTVSTIWQRLRDEHGLTASATSVRRYVWREFPDRVGADQVTVWRPPVEAGDEAQIDYGYLGAWFDPVVERVRRVWAFIMVLACSRHMFVRPVLSMNQSCWVEAHVAAFEFFAGCPARLVPDNLKTGVVKPDLYDPKLNRAYAEMAAHYGCLVDPARASKPKDKPRVERPVSYVRDSLWAGRTWTDLAHMQTAALTWCVKVAGQRHHRSLDGAQPYSVFLAVEAPALRPLPPERFELAAWSRPKVSPDCHVKVAGALYSVPWRLIGRRVDARVTAATVEVFVDARLVKTHRRITRGRQTDWADYPPEKVAFFMRTPAWCRRRAGELGAHVAVVVGELLIDSALHHLRAAQGVIGLAERHDIDRLDDACRRALEVGDPTYRTIKGILTTATTSEPVQLAAASTPAHLHGAARLFNPDREAVS
jgi:transposase